MIKCKSDLQFYLEQDRKAMNKSGAPKLFSDEIYRFEITMRKLEYYTNVCTPHYYLLRQFYRFKYHLLSVKLGFSIPINTFDAGLAIVHYGYIAVSQGARIGKNCRIQTGVIIGATNGEKEGPQIGDNVYIGAGAKIIGKVKVADNVAIGANAVVVKSIAEEGITVAGVPEKKVSDHSSKVHLSHLII